MIEYSGLGVSLVREYIRLEPETLPCVKDMGMNRAMFGRVFRVHPKTQTRGRGGGFIVKGATKLWGLLRM